MNIVVVLVLAAIVFFVIYILSSREQKKESERFAPRGKVEEYCSVEKDRRRCERLETELDVKYNLIPSLKPDFSTNARNISKSGISILVYEILPKGSLIDMEISVPDSKEAIKLKGKVAWCEGRSGPERADKDGKRTFMVGVEFVDTDKNQREALTEYMHRHASRDEKLQ